MAREIPEVLREKLERGSRGWPDTMLTSDECWALLQLLPQARGRPEDDMVYARDQIAAALFALYVANGDTSKAAINRLKARFGMKRTQIYAAVKRYPADYTNLDPDERREAIYENENNPLV